MNIRIDINEAMLRAMIVEYLRNKLGDVELKTEEIRIEVKSKQNYKSEWESADFRAVYEGINK